MVSDIRKSLTVWEVTEFKSRKLFKQGEEVNFVECC